MILSNWIYCDTSVNLEILAPSADMHNIHFVVTILYSFSQGCTTSEILLNIFSFSDKISTKALNTNALILQRKTSKIILPFKKWMAGILLLCICKLTTDRGHTE